MRFESGILEEKGLRADVYVCLDLFRECYAAMADFVRKPEELMEMYEEILRAVLAAEGLK